MATYTLEECESKIAEFEAALDELASLPTRGQTGKTTIDLTGASERVRDQLEMWKTRRDALSNGGYLPPLRRDC